MRTAESDAGSVDRSGGLPDVGSPEFGALARRYWDWTVQACGGSAEPDPLGGAPIPRAFYRWL